MRNIIDDKDNPHITSLIKNRFSIIIVENNETIYKKGFQFNLPRTRQSQASSFAEESLSIFCKGLLSSMQRHIPDNHLILTSAAFQVLMQLAIEFIKNSLDANATNLIVEIIYRPEKNITQILLSDNGDGFGQHYPAGVYFLYNFEEAFLSSSPKKQLRECGYRIYGGANLGLAMAQHYLKTYGAGRLSIRNRQSGGACILLESNNTPCTKVIQLCEASPELYYLNEILNSVKETIFANIASKHGMRLTLSAEEFNRIRLAVIKQCLYEISHLKIETKLSNSYVIEKLEVAIILSASASRYSRGVFHPYKSGEAMPGRARPAPLDPNLFQLSN